MHNIKWIRENKDLFDEGMKKRGLEPFAEKLLMLDEKKRQLITLMQTLKQAKNEKARMIAEMKDKASQEFLRARDDCNDMSVKLAEIEAKIENEIELDDLLSSTPNIPADDVPYGKDENDNVEIKRVGTPRIFSFKPKEHFEIGEKLGLMDFEQTAKISGSRFVTLKGDFAQLERALASFMIDNHTKKFGFREISAPFLVKDKAMYGVGQLPKFAEESFQTTKGHRLIPTSEVTLTNLYSDMIIDTELPARMTSFSRCFRSEAGSAGKDTRGMIRLHEFNKVELVSITKPEDSEKELEHITNAAESILEDLELPYRRMLLCTGDMGFSSSKTYDLEVWLPGQNKYREISSCSNCRDFQARRMKSRFRPDKTSNDTVFVHTLNGSGLAIGRTMVAIIENYQNEDGSITIPMALRSYMGSKEVIK